MSMAHINIILMHSEKSFMISDADSSSKSDDIKVLPPAGLGELPDGHTGQFLVCARC